MAETEQRNTLPVMILLPLRWCRCFLGLLWLCSLTRNAVGWGPFSHAAFGSLYYESLCRSEVAASGTQTRRRGQLEKALIANNCTLSPSAQPPVLEEAVFVTANSFPDAFKYTRSWMHSLEYAAFQMEKAALWNSTTNTKSSLHSGEHCYLNHSTKQPSSRHSAHYHWNHSLDFIQTDVIKAFSFGYLLHVLQDYVGHHHNGYLNPEKDHPLEFDVDTLFFELHKKDGAPWFYRNRGMTVIAKDIQIRHDVASFVSETTQQFAQFLKTATNSTKGGISNDNSPGKIDIPSLVDSVSGLSIKQVIHCMDRFTTLINMDAVAMTANSRTYKNGMVRYNVCGAQNFGDANVTLKTAILWTENALHVLETLLFPWDLPSPVRHHSHQTDSAVRNKVLEASIVARSWIDDTFQMNGGTICNNHSWEFA